MKCRKMEKTIEEREGKSEKKAVDKEKVQGDNESRSETGNIATAQY